MRAEFESYRHEVTVTFPMDVLPINGDAMRIEQVVTNLLNNAIKYTRPGGHIRISIKRHFDEAFLTLVDDGIGMEAEFIPTIFDIFVQAERSLDRTSAGLGLGLAPVHRLVALHGGDVRAYSDGLNRGSKFVVRLPALPRGTVPEDPPHVAMNALPSTGAVRILIVDDNVDALESSAARWTAPRPCSWWRNSAPKRCCSISACPGWMATRWHAASGRCPVSRTLF
jgi:two-component system CheB/CheR fusion protein